MQLRAFRHVTAVAAVLVFVGVGCGGTSGPDPAAAPRPGDGLYEIRGTVVAVDRPRGIVEIDHEAIPGVMPAMEMPYEVADPGLLQDLSRGDRVRGTLRVDSRGYVITALQRL
jgi:Cu/Ag efflux protein CusF